MGFAGIPRPIASTYVLSILYNVTFFCQFVTTPYLIKSLGISDASNGFLQTAFGVLQMVGGPIFGHIIKAFGIRNALILCYFSTMVSGIALYLAQDFNTLLISRLTVLFMHGQQGHQTLLAAFTKPGQERTNAFSRMGLTFGIGFVFTPVICYISTKLFSERAPFLISAIIAAIPFIILERFIPKETTSSDTEEVSAQSSVGIQKSIEILKRPGVLNVLLKKNLPIIPALLLFGVLQLYMMNEFQMDAETSHLVQLVTGIYIMINNGFGVIWLRKRFEEETLLIIGTIAFTIGYFLYFFFTKLWFIFVITPFISFGMSLVATVSDSVLTSLVSDEEQGLILGVATSLNSLVRTIAPAVSGYLLDNHGFIMFPIIGTISCILGHLILWFAPLNTTGIKKKSE